MIVSALYRHYETLLADPDSSISRPGLSKAKVGHGILLSPEGELVDILDLRVERRGKLVTRTIDVPAQQKRTIAISANFMADNCSYVLGLGQKGKKEARVRDCFAAFVALHERLLSAVDEQGALALLLFLRAWQPEKALSHPVVARHAESLAEGGTIVFRLRDRAGYLHEQASVIAVWHRHNDVRTSLVHGQCLVTGKTAPLARLHSSIKGVTGAQSSGAALVSFNKPAFTSYGKEQSFNSPVSEEAAFGYTTALNHLLSSEKHRVRIGDATVVLWAEVHGGGREEDLLTALLNPSIYAEDDGGDTTAGQLRQDPETTKLVYDILQRIRAGKPLLEGSDGLRYGAMFYILGLAPNASRLAVRFCHANNYGSFIELIGRHHCDMALEKTFTTNPDVVPISLILKEAAPLKDSKRISPLLGGVLMRAILTGAPYPTAVYSAMITRIRADREVNYVRVSVIKAYLARKYRSSNKGSEVQFTMSLNEQSRNEGYLLGRLFAVLEKAQTDANPGINATIRDRYFGSASASPNSVFPILLRLAQHHVAKAEYGQAMDRRIGGIVSLINRFPSHLGLDGQGQFILGYYQQRNALYVKSEKKESVE
ncbi:MAG: type I-C CRISPR-associated protein Cas8c/Csd1 [Firmicutes bacterium]|nr:type I-C CRISPR-associated protein Cas8c/Csd1 [Dethiobacter sp.]MBS3887677.1 type I-C CRISPR-associated protein Cas8c/Csd1 [Bacillota bacterium]MBS4054616.1 type I-C CRISPR-associated protein Cas8c/Csd1 [Thermaerobacter sp.]